MKTELTKLEKSIYNYWIENDKDKSKLVGYIARVIPYDDYEKLRGSFSEGKAEQLIKKFKSIEVDTYTVSKDFILEAHKDACSTWKNKIENQFPDLFAKVELEVGKWYKTMGHSLVFVTKELKNNSEIGFGFDGTGKWTDNWHYYSHNKLTLATKEEVETALIAEAKKRGFKEGVTFNSVEPNANGKTIIKMDEYIYYDDILGFVYSNCGYIFKNGKWAEIISEPIEISLDEIAEKFGVDVSLIKIKK